MSDDGRVIWKFPLAGGTEQIVTMPVGAQVMCVQMQHDTPTLWAVVKPSNPTEKRRFVIRATGEPFEGVGSYVGTVQIQWFVGHVFSMGAVP